ncbi:hypothetical protein [Streptomyces sp. NPDC057616]|uniref:hypothetical protein n=1 Tax=Streptomyces sp. NPDC057616 TaxID=3346183 RepID=UPI003696AD1F
MDAVDVAFADLMSPERVVPRAVLEADFPSHAGAMTMTWHLTAADENRGERHRTDVPPGIGQAVHEAGIASSPANPASSVEATG